MGETDKAMEGCLKCFKQCAFGCGLYCLGCRDGIYNCIKIAQLSCSTGIKSYADLTKNTQYFANMLKEALGLETGNEPLRSMAEFKPWFPIENDDFKLFNDFLFIFYKKTLRTSFKSCGDQ